MGELKWPILPVKTKTKNNFIERSQKFNFECAVVIGYNDQICRRRPTIL